MWLEIDDEIINLDKIGNIKKYDRSYDYTKRFGIDMDGIYCFYYKSEEERDILMNRIKEGIKNNGKLIRIQ